MKWHNKKQVTFQKIFQLDVIQEDWEKLKTNFQQEKFPVIEWNEDYFDETRYFELTGEEQLSTFELRNIPSGETYPFHVLSLVSGYNEGTFTVNENLLFLQQKLVDFNIKLSIQPSDEKVVTGESFPIIDGETFVPSIGGSAYTFGTSPSGQLTNVDFTDSDDQIFFKNNFPMGTITQVLLPSGEIITVEITEEGTVLVSE